MNQALNCIVGGRLSVSRPGRQLDLNTDISAYLNRGEPVERSGPHDLFLNVGHVFQINEAEGERGRYKTSTVAYWYQFETPDQREIISFHLNRRASGDERPYPHIHIGSAVAAASPVLPDRFNKLHIPTRRISIESVVRFAIQELKVEIMPGRTVKAVLDLLDEGESAFDRWKTTDS